ncbi:Mpo1-like protein [Myxococcus xanthus]|uniref:DUF962 domain-containing protein n=1 Tax=Myxococcus xanthus TaxID=34 RepID=A0A7Y4II26_MYXXA|nr:DUF962 domain-containing protein [Myxococcus xanthus]NOJ79713.1 DUF962 domain-containing protein [Myxococcus xanthus]NOJ90081.1 DUF962 domain-containing protein [Myxococcus xanthus]
MLGDRPWEEWISEYSKSHTHAVNRLFHTVGIPMIAASVPLAAASPFVPRLWKVPAALFVVGWSFQFVGHAFERKPPEFLKDWRFLFVGLRWWAAKVAGKA